ncbi:polysaccharide deacetylase family protein [Granulicella cerasi]|uniref:Polysaccharide deacetylase family protein n=1 Tax=Granulicella cerasi TaxID=741063 RepID=A0ABW1ZDV2_9BACT|nr:polysaccharide deacetylase family protein [Granulicella cerasi]
MISALASSASGTFASATIAGAAVLGTAYILADATLRPESQLFGRTVVAGYDPAEVALTFDDGPNTAMTPALLDLLAEHRVRATFFMIGRFAREEKMLARRVHDAGHLVGNHTVTHPWLAWQSSARVREELRGCNAMLEDAIGAPITVFRPPHGARRPVVLRTAQELGMATVQWNAMGQDWLHISSEQIVKNLGRGMRRAEKHRRGSNLLLHDGYDVQQAADRSATLAAVRMLLETLPAQGKRFVGVDEWVSS